MQLIETNQKVYKKYENLHKWILIKILKKSQTKVEIYNSSTGAAVSKSKPITKKRRKHSQPFTR